MLLSSSQVECCSCSEAGINCVGKKGKVIVRSAINGEKLGKAHFENIRDCKVITPTNVQESTKDDSDENDQDPIDAINLSRKEITALRKMLVSSGIVNQDLFAEADQLPQNSGEYFAIILDIIEQLAVFGVERELTESELMGIESEERIISVVSQQIFEDIFDQSKIVHAEHMSEMDQNGIDILVYLQPKIAELLKKPAVPIQVKSSQSLMQKAVERTYTTKQKNKPKYVDRDSIEKCLIYCNGQHADETIVASIIMQMAALIWERSGEDALNQFSNLLSNELQLNFQRIYSQDLLARDYSPVANGILHSSYTDKMSGIPKSTEPSIYVEMVSAALLGIESNSNTNLRAEKSGGTETHKQTRANFNIPQQTKSRFATSPY